MPCDQCKLPYPDEMLNQMFIGGQDGSGYTAPVCGICALEMSNKTLGVNRKRFQGEMAEEFRQRAIDWRKKHPNAQKVGS